MLVLVRRRDESIVIDGNVVVTILGVEGDRVKVGIQAPREITILRQELCEQVISANRPGVESSAEARRLLPESKGRLKVPRMGSQVKFRLPP
ncbi:MAG: carbon storage regulator [Dehalococcoidia bacterium]|nr:carbon storage regulator [Dehalococcoidia bacterium]